MKVSVVIPVHNKAPYLRECLDSVFAQTFSDFEVIAVDDRSTDDSLAVLRSYTDPRLQVVVQERNGGPATAVRTAMDRAKGEYIIRMDADDVAMPERFAAQVDFMDAHPDIGISGSRVVELHDPTAERSVLLDADALLAESFFTVPVFQPTAIYRRSVLVAYGLAFQPEWPRIGEDWLFYVHASAVTRFGNIDRALVRRYLGPTSSTQDCHGAKRGTVGEQRRS
jgi:glycosyltransferase involved in cell wall biosynthesis